MILEDDEKSLDTKAFTNVVYPTEDLSRKFNNQVSIKSNIPSEEIHENSNEEEVKKINTVLNQVNNNNPLVPVNKECLDELLDAQDDNTGVVLEKPSIKNIFGSPQDDNTDLTKKEEYQAFINYHFETFLVKFDQEKKENFLTAIEDRSKVRKQLEINPKKRLLVLYVDGNKDSETLLKHLDTEIIAKGSSCNYFLLANYIYDADKDNDYNFANKKDTVLTVYSAKLTGLILANEFVIEQKRPFEKMFMNDYEGTEFNQVFSLATSNKASFLVSSFNSLKGPLGANSVLDKNLHNLLLSSKVPVMLFKEFYQRESSSNSSNKDKSRKGGFNWFVLLDNTYINCFKALTTFAEFIDKDRDYIHAFGAYPSYITYDVFQKQFTEFCQYNNFKNYSYESGSYVKSVADLVFEKVNYEPNNFDFLVFYNNSERHFVKKEDSESWKILKKTQANICFINNLFI